MRALDERHAVARCTPFERDSLGIDRRNKSPLDAIAHAHRARRLARNRNDGTALAIGVCYDAKRQYIRGWSSRTARAEQGRAGFEPIKRIGQPNGTQAHARGNWKRGPGEKARDPKTCQDAADDDQQNGQRELRKMGAGVRTRESHWLAVSEMTNAHATLKNRRFRLLGREWD
jgi:hypothetical protein